MIEDEARIRAFVVPYLQKAGFSVDEADNGEQGLSMALSGKYALVLLDLMLPGISGMDVCAGLRRVSRVPILMLTARSEEADVVSGFEAGADDYLTKPFSPNELTARVKALLARCSPTSETPLVFGPLSIDPDALKVFLDGSPLTLTPKEFDLLRLLAVHPGRTFTREMLLQQIWGYEAAGDTRTVDTHVKQLREKLGDCRGMLVTVWGRGYRLVNE